MKKEIKGYIAGFLDGEAGFQIKRYKDIKQKRGYGLAVGIRVSNTNQEILLYLKSLFGGCVAEHKLNSNKGKWKKAYRWQISSKKAQIVIETIYPYLIIKKPQADIMLRFVKTLTNSTKKLSNDVMDKRWKLKGEINKLNKRGL